jgi:predicted methyltransferase
MRVVLGLVTAALVAASAVMAAPAHIDKAVADPDRPPAHRALDDARRPAEVMTFAGIRTGQRIAEYLPGGGYYTRLLSAAAGPGGTVYAMETSTWSADYQAETRKNVSGLANTVLTFTPLGELSLPEKVDVFWTTLNYHDLHIAKYAKVPIATFNRRVFESLKPGGTYFVIDHAARPGSGAADAATLHRIEKAALIREVTAAGFRLEGESKLLANPKDDYSKGVFDPAVRGKTDQFVLKFRRP